MDDLDPVWSRAAGREVAPFVRKPHGVRLVGDRGEVVLMNEMAAPLSFRPKPTGTYPAPNGLGVAPDAIRCLHYGEHDSKDYYIA
jgi:hypothetical protein